MTRIKLCGLTRPCDIQAANLLKPDYVGFVFAPGSRRCLSPAQAAELRLLLNPGILAVGVFVDERPEQVAALLSRGIIDAAQLHGQEGEAYLQALRRLTDKPILQAFRIASPEDVAQAEASSADGILLDSGAGSGAVLDWTLLKGLSSPCFLAGGLTPDNVAAAIDAVRPYAVDVSSGIETGGQKDPQKMAAFMAAVRKEERE